ncbi:MAG: lipoyl synthase [Arsenophonus sp.]|nr:MAG: lipoyl synthase [Arsenophonus sp.]
MNKKNKNHASLLNNDYSSKKKFSIPITTLTSKKIKKLKKPTWIKIKLPSNHKRIQKIKRIIKKNNLNSICEEASCPNIAECFNKGTATFMILGSICTRKCPFCNVNHGRPKLPDQNEPKKLAQAIKKMKLNYVVITSVDRDDLRDGGAKQFSYSINAIREENKNIKIEILVPDFRGCTKLALKILKNSPPDVFNHNIENVPRIYKIVRPGANYKKSLLLLKNFKKMNPNIPTKSGLMLGLGETDEEILEVMSDLRHHGVNMLTLGQYLQPSLNHLPVLRYITMEKFSFFKEKAKKMGFINVASGPLVRSSYHADLQAKNLK